MASWYDEDDDEEDYEEEEVWDVVRERRSDVSPRAKKANKDLSTFATSSSSYSSSSSSSSTSNKRLPTSSRMIPRKNSSSSSTSSSSSGTTTRQSAPVNIPDWSKIYQLKNHPSPHDDESYNSMGGYNNGGLLEEEDDDGSEGEEEEAGKVPPHEWLAKKMARTRISSFSVCEGAGRTLKGRDLSKVRNAVLTRTGFLE